MVSSVVRNMIDAGEDPPDEGDGEGDDANKEDKRDTNLLFPGHFEAPDRAERQDGDCKV